jgi:hypothetical protein
MISRLSLCDIFKVERVLFNVKTTRFISSKYLRKSVLSNDSIKNNKKNFHNNNKNKHIDLNEEKIKNSDDIKEIIENKNRIITIPNVLTMSRICSIPFINYFVFIERHDLACGLFILASITDFLDGLIARNVPNQESYLGN